MKVLSLFDGMSCGRIALDRAGIKVDSYHASEVDKYAIKVTQANWPETVQLGDVTTWREWDIDWKGIDLLIGGSPCQGFSFAGKQLAFDDPRSKLFFVYVDILNHIKSLNHGVKFMLENVKMKKEYLAIISEQLGVEPVFINSNLVSAQNRQRYYWANWKIEQPKDHRIMLADILEVQGVGYIKNHGEYKERNDSLESKPIQCLEVHEHGKSRCLSTVAKDTVVSSLPKGRYVVSMKQKPRGNNKGFEKEVTKCPTISTNAWEHNNHIKVRDKSKCLRSSGRGSYDRHEWDSISNCHYRKLTLIECERLQTVPDNYTNHVSNTQRYKMLGNGWTVDVIAHIFLQMEVPIALIARQQDMFGDAA